jgi:signal transduction histidine kinase
VSAPPEWLDRVAHDLRGPLMPLQTAVQLLRSDQLEAPRRAELLDVIERQARQLTQLIAELDDWNRVTRHRLLGRREPVEPALLLDAASVGAGIPVTIATDAAPGTSVEGDAQRLTQLLRILIGFLASHGEAPTATLATTGDRLRIDLEAAGFEPDDATATLFEQPQGHPHDGGLGLQLLIARGIAEAHGGALEARPDSGRLRLRCELPLAPA